MDEAAGAHSGGVSSGLAVRELFPAELPASDRVVWAVRTVGWDKGTPKQGAALITEPWQADEAGQAFLQGLAGYLSAVAEAIGVPEEGTTFEVSDTATAYLALERRWPPYPGRDLMLLWSEQTGWTVSLEPGPGEPSMVLAHLGGTDRVPEPQAVAQFVTDVLAEGAVEPGAPAVVNQPNRLRLAESMTRYAAGS